MKIQFVLTFLRHSKSTCIGYSLDIKFDTIAEFSGISLVSVSMDTRFRQLSFPTVEDVFLVVFKVAEADLQFLFILA